MHSHHTCTVFAGDLADRGPDHVYKVAGVVVDDSSG
jgi:hypothetical protein